MSLTQAAFTSPVREAGDCELARSLRFGNAKAAGGAAFSVVMWHTGLFDSRGSERMGYRVRCIRSRPGWAGSGSVWSPFEAGQVIFQAEDFSGSPMHASDSDATFGALLGFLSLRPGDTDSDYFEGYSALQLAFADYYGEELSTLAWELEESEAS